MLHPLITESPRERCLRGGAECLSLRECLALILERPGEHGLAQRILEFPGSGLTPNFQEEAFFLAIEAAGTAQFHEVPGLDADARARLLASFELARRYRRHIHPRSSGGEPIQLCTARGGAALALKALSKVPAYERDQSKEWLGFVAITGGFENRVGSLCVVERGVRTHVNVDPAELFARLLSVRPRAFVLFHNHPSGDLSPSNSDLDLTRKVGQVSAQLGIQLLGHWIVTARAERWLDSTIRAKAAEP